MNPKALTPQERNSIFREELNRDKFAVVCLECDGYVLATRQVFFTREAAEAYASTVAQSRVPIVVAGPWGQLRVPLYPEGA